MYMDNLNNGEKEVWCLFLTSNFQTTTLHGLTINIYKFLQRLAPLTKNISFCMTIQ